MNETLTLQHVFGCEKPILDVVFVHGLTGDPRKTWLCPANGEFWPAWLQVDFNSIAVYTLGYPASLIERWPNKEMDMFERAGNVLEQFAGVGIGERPIAFVAHSLGGILVKLLLRRSIEAGDEDWQKVAEVTRLVVFLSTPHIGSAVARVMQIVPGISGHVDLLANKFGFLEDLNRHYRSIAKERGNLSTVVYYEKRLTKKIIVVPRESADPGIGNVEPVPVDKNHLDICKPVNKGDTVYLGIKRHIQKAVNSAEKTASGADKPISFEGYENRSTEDRRDLLQKLIDAGREHEYRYANDAQNKFARQYTKTGLFTSAREDHESLLSEIETRFVTHVYHPLICRSVPDGEIRAAIQKEVIDPLVSRDIGGTRFPAKAVLSGLYFLTEQCHIRWDFSK